MIDIQVGQVCLVRTYTDSLENEWVSIIVTNIFPRDAYILEGHLLFPRLRIRYNRFRAQDCAGYYEQYKATEYVV